jgi:hypothetical protein
MICSMRTKLFNRNQMWDGCTDMRNKNTTGITALVEKCYKTLAYDPFRSWYLWNINHLFLKCFILLLLCNFVLCVVGFFFCSYHILSWSQLYSQQYDFCHTGRFTDLYVLDPKVSSCLYIHPTFDFC